MNMRKIGERILDDLKAWRIPIAALGIYYILTRLLFGGFCPMVILSGFPCPGCGLTRSIMLLLIGRIGQSLQMHPLGWLWAIWIFALIWIKYVLGKSFGRKTAIICALLCILTLDVYAYRMIFYFGKSPALVYTNGNILERTIPGYGELWARILAR